MQVEQLIIQKIASRPSTEELIFFIAEDDAITSACSELQRKIAGNNKKELKNITALCRRYRISLAYLTGELHHVQNIFAPQKTISDDYRILGLPAGANFAEVKQAYRKLSIKYHPDTSNEKNTAQFIEITKAYQRIINSPDKEDKNKTSPVPPSSSAWRYRKNTPPPPQREKKYLYLFLLVTGAVVLVIVSLSVHYQKRAMLNNISKKNQAPTKQTSLTGEKAPAANVQPAAQQEHPLVSNSEIEQEAPPVSAITINNLSLLHSSQEDVPAVPAPPAVPAALVSSKSMPQVIHPLASEEKTEIEVENLTSPISVSHVQSEINDSEKSSVQEFSAQEPDRMEANSIVRVEEHNEIFSDILKQEEPVGKKIEATAPVPAAVVVVSVQQTPKQKKISSVFPEKRYKKAVIVKPEKRKIRKKKLPTPDVEQISPGMSTQDSLRQFVKSYTSAYMNRDIKKLSLFFTKGAQENGEPFTQMRAKYKQLFDATQSIDYRIDIVNTDIQKKGTAATLTGRLHVQLTYSPDKIKSNTGTLTFFLVKKGRNYKIKALNYNIDPKW